MLTQEHLHEVLAYNLETGLFVWRIRLSGPDRVGKVAGSVTVNGYIQVWVDGRAYLAHRLAWFYVKGVWPVRIDHRDQNKKNNAWDNLREATQPQNMANVRTHKSNSSGFKGVSPRTKHGVYIARIKQNYKNVHLGCFKTAEEAAAAYRAKALELHGEFAA